MNPTHQPATAQQIERLRELEAAASPAPWNVVDYRHGDRSQETWLGILNGAIEIKYSALPTEENHANAALIAESRNLLPALLNSHAALLDVVRKIAHGEYDNAHDCMFAARLARATLANKPDEPRNPAANLPSAHER